MEGKEELFTKKYVFIEGNLKNRYLRKGFLEKKHCKTRNYYKYFQLKFFSKKIFILYLKVDSF